jgi:hypothetical protein
MLLAHAGARQLGIPALVEDGGWLQPKVAGLRRGLKSTGSGQLSDACLCAVGVPRPRSRSASSPKCLVRVGDSARRTIRGMGHH